MRLISLLRLLVLSGLALVASGCIPAMRGGSLPYNSPNFVAPDAPTTYSANDSSYKLAPLDVVNVTVFQVPELTREYPIDFTGHLSMPLVGTVNAIGLSTSELAKELQTRLGTKYLRDPNVTVALKESKSRMITVDGAVNQAGVFTANGPLTLIQAIALAKGTDGTANPRRVAVFRTIGGKRMGAAFDLTDIRRGKEPDPPIYAGDVVVVDGSNLRKAQSQLLGMVPLLPYFTAL